MFLDIEAQILEIQGMKAALVEGEDQGVGLDSTGFYDQEIYGGSDSRFAGYVTSIAANEQEEVCDAIILLEGLLKVQLQFSCVNYFLF